MLNMKRMSKFKQKKKEDLEFARRTNAALKRIEAGKGITMTCDEFIKELEKC